ncbi:MAG: heme NO-binding domain-containing protein [Albidovulum sp.]
MHGLINRAIQNFLGDTYGDMLWHAVAEEAGVGAQGFEAMLRYEDAVTDAVLDAASRQLAKPREALLEDLGMFLVSLEPLRRLMRFGGVDYVDFLSSLDELRDRARLAVSDLDMPDLTLTARGANHFVLSCRAAHPGFAPVFNGVLRAMADDYGALALIDLGPEEDGEGKIAIELLQSQFASGRRFDLARPEAS